MTARIGNTRIRTIFSASKLLALSFACIMASGCASSTKGRSAPSPESSTTQQSEAAGPPLPYGPLPQSNPDPTQPSYGPDPVLLRPAVLVLGPGGARGFAHAGVIRALREAKVPIGAIVASDMGALIGALYATSENINAFEWSLLHLKEDIFLTPPSLIPVFSEGPSDGQKLQAVLYKLFGRKTFQDLKIPLKVVVHLQRLGKPVIIEEGRIGSAVRAATALPALFTAVALKGERAISGAMTRPWPVSEAKAMDMGPVIAVDLLGEDATAEGQSGNDQAKEIAQQMATARKAGWRDLQDADVVIRPDLEGIGWADFSRRTDIEFRGRKALSGQIREIRRLVGMPQPLESARNGSME